MKRLRFVIPSLIVLMLAVLVAVVSCSKSSSYQPTNPGGGGGGGLELNSGTLSGSGQGYQHVFPTAGTFGYHCTIHGTAMAGTVTVVASSTNDSVVVQIGPGLAYNPASTSVKPGGTVRWVNGSGAAHTVTSN